VMGGSLSVHSVEGEGTVFELRLPVSAPHTASPLQI
jgi:signal transduction histidine kinase